MNTKQQEETHKYFDAYAQDWKEKATGQKVTQVNVIAQRNDYVLEVVKSRSDNEKTLDVGCGTGELVHEIAKMNIHAIGVDFANEMVKTAEATAKAQNIQNTEFVCASIFDFPVDNNSLDVMSANGFIEYISHQQFELFLANSHQSLKPGGSLVLGSRNRLFNVVSMNRFTLEEIENNCMEKLMREAIQLAKVNDPADLLQTKALPFESTDREHGHTGIDVSTRFQYTPAQLVKLLDEKGFVVKGLCPIHIHGSSPAFLSEFKEAHFNISNLLSQVSNEHREARHKLIPFASSFMIHAVKK